MRQLREAEREIEQAAQEQTDVEGRIARARVDEEAAAGDRRGPGGQSRHAGRAGAPPGARRRQSGHGWTSTAPRVRPPPAPSGARKASARSRGHGPSSTRRWRASPSWAGGWSRRRPVPGIGGRHLSAWSPLPAGSADDEARDEEVVRALAALVEERRRSLRHLRTLEAALRKAEVLLDQARAAAATVEADTDEAATAQREAADALEAAVEALRTATAPSSRRRASWPRLPWKSWSTRSPTGRPSRRAPRRSPGRWLRRWRSAWRASRSCGPRPNAGCASNRARWRRCGRSKPPSRPGCHRPPDAAHHARPGRADRSGGGPVLAGGRLRRWSAGRTPGGAGGGPRGSGDPRRLGESRREAAGAGRPRRPPAGGRARDRWRPAPRDGPAAGAGSPFRCCARASSPESRRPVVTVELVAALLARIALGDTAGDGSGEVVTSP